MALDPHREIYPNAPLKLVAFELRFPPVRRFDSDDGQQALYEALREEFPILGPPPVMEIEMSPGGTRQNIRGTRMLNRSRTRTVTFTDQALTVETSAYRRFEEFAELVRTALEAADQVGRLPAVLRAGLRYIDEIVVLGVTHVEAWADYITEDLLSPAVFQDYETIEYRGTLGLRVADNHRVDVRFGAVDTPVVDPDGPLRIHESPSGQYFLLDVDSAWTAPGEEFLEFDVEATLGRCEALHEPVREIFERAVKPKLRDEVFRKDADA